MKYLIVILFCCVLVSCSTSPPTEDEVKQNVELWYVQQSSADGAGGWDVKSITVLSITKDADHKGIFNTVSLVNGIRHHPPLAVPRPNEPFSDTLRMALEWNGAKWVTTQ